MKKGIFIIITTLLASFYVLLAQQPQDTLLTRQLELQREFNPTLQDANKINTLPSLKEPQITKANTAYATWGTRATPALEISLPPISEVMTKIPFSTQRGYIALNGGNYANIDGSLGYRLVDSDNDKLSLMFLHNSSNGNVDYNQEANPQSHKMRFMDNFAKLNYNHLFESTVLDLNTSFLHSQFNYYGNNFGQTRWHDDKNQVVSVFNINAALQNSTKEEINYLGSVDFNMFDTKHGINLTDNSVKGNQIQAALDLNKSFFGGDSHIGAKGSFTGVFYDDFTLTNGEDVSSFTMLDLNPYLTFEGLTWKANIGANVDFVFGDDNKSYVSPNIAFSILVADNSSLYVNAIGGVSKNTYLDVYKETRYLMPNTLVKHSYSPISVEAGTKIGSLDGFRIDLFGGYKKIQDEHFFIQHSQEVDPPGDVSEATYTYHEFLVPIYGNMSNAFVGGKLHSNIWSQLDVSVGVKKNFYTVDKLKTLAFNLPTELKAWNKPGMEVELDATFVVTNELKVNLGYYFANDRWSVHQGRNVEMDNINNLSAGASYLINKMFSVNLKANNILNQSYDLWYAHPAQGVSVMGGFNFNF